MTPFLDVLTGLLIFLIVTFSPEEATIEVDPKLNLPQSSHTLKGVPHLKVELGQEQVRVNGEVVQGLQLSTASTDTWDLLRKILKDQKKDENAVLVIADKGVSYKFVDHTAALVAAAGFADIYFLTEMQFKEEGEKK